MIECLWVKIFILCFSEKNHGKLAFWQGHTRKFYLTRTMKKCLSEKNHGKMSTWQEPWLNVDKSRHMVN